jgi:hypothetical protein
MAREIIYAKSTRREYYKFLAVIVFIALSATLMSTLINFRFLDWVRWFVGSSLLVFGGFKLISYESFLDVFPRYDLIAARYRWYALIYPFLEVILGICFILDMIAGFRNILTFAIMAVGAYGIIMSLQKRGPSKQYTLLGQAFKLPLSTGILFEDILLSIMMLTLLIGAVLS